MTDAGGAPARQGGGPLPSDSVRGLAPPTGRATVQVAVAVPFEAGVILAVGGTSHIVKTPWGLLAAVGRPTAALTPDAGLKGAGLRFHRLPPLGVAGVHDELMRSGGGEDGLHWLFSHEVDPLRTDDPTCADPRGPASVGGLCGWLGAPVCIYRDGGQGPVLSRWGAVLVSHPAGRGEPSGLGRDAEVFLQARLDRGTGSAERMRAALDTVGWVLSQAADASAVDQGLRPSEATVGIHEAGHSYSVDRVPVRDWEPGAGMVDGT